MPNAIKSFANLGNPLSNAESRIRNNSGIKSKLYLYPYCEEPVPEKKSGGKAKNIIAKIAPMVYFFFFADIR